MAKRTETSIDITSNYLHAQQSKGRRARESARKRKEKKIPRPSTNAKSDTCTDKFIYVCMCI